MKKTIQIIIDVELSARTNDGLQAATEEALSRVSCDFVLSTVGEEVSGVMVQKQINHGDGWSLAKTIMRLRGLDAEEFFELQHADATIARHLFAYSARKFLAWDWAEICEFLERDRTGLSAGVENIKGLSSKKKKTNSKVSKYILRDKDQILKDVESIAKAMSSGGVR